MSESKLNIYQKLAKIRKPVAVLRKNKQGYGYKYVTEDLILEKITGLMEKYGVSLFPSITPGTTTVNPYSYTKTKVTKNAEKIEETVNDIIVQSEIIWTWVNDENPEDRVSIPWTLVGQQSDAAQAFGTGLSYSSRYFLLKYFNVATTEEDPDAWRSRQKEAEQAEDREIAHAIIEQAHNHVNAYLEAHKEDREKILELTKKYNKIANGKASNTYFDIKDPEVAAQFYKELTATFTVTEKSAAPAKDKSAK